MMKISNYDPEVDAMSIQIVDENVLESEEIAEGIVVDYNDKGEIIGFELLDMNHITISSLRKLKSLLSPDVVAMLQEFNIFSKVLCWNKW